jgi:hypothetical protein
MPICLPIIADSLKLAKIQMPQSVDILALIAADLPGLDAMLGGLVDA